MTKFITIRQLLNLNKNYNNDNLIDFLQSKAIKIYANHKTNLLVIPYDLIYSSLNNDSNTILLSGELFNFKGEKTKFLSTKKELPIDNTLKNMKLFSEALSNEHHKNEAVLVGKLKVIISDIDKFLITSQSLIGKKGRDINTIKSNANETIILKGYVKLLDEILTNNNQEFFVKDNKVNVSLLIKELEGDPTKYGIPSNNSKKEISRGFGHGKLRDIYNKALL